MRIIQLHSENVKRIKAIDITPTEDVIILSGKNGAGKTSVLDSIWLALQYKAAKRTTPEPLRAGEKKGQVTIDIGDYIVTRKFTEGHSTLEIRKPGGDRVPSPQKLLDGLIGDLSFDPWEFSRKKESDQREMLADVLYQITEGKVDLADFDVRHQEAYDKRTEINKEKRRLTVLLTQMAPPTATDPEEEVSVTDLTASITDAISVQARFATLDVRGHDVSQKIIRLEKELHAAQLEKVAIMKELEDMPEPTDVEFLKGELTNIQQRNARAREVQTYRTTKLSLEEVDTAIKDLNDTMELIEINKAEALEESPLPVSGLRITPDGVMVTTEGGDELVPFCQASAAQRLRISLGIAMAANPTLRVIRIADGSLLDDESMQIIKDMANDQDFQVWVEYASRNKEDRMGVYIEEGAVAMVETTP